MLLQGWRTTPTVFGARGPFSNQNLVVIPVSVNPGRVRVGIHHNRSSSRGDPLTRRCPLRPGVHRGFPPGGSISASIPLSLAAVPLVPITGRGSILVVTTGRRGAIPLTQIPLTGRVSRSRVPGPPGRFHPALVHHRLFSGRWSSIMMARVCTGPTVTSLFLPLHSWAGAGGW